MLNLIFIAAFITFVFLFFSKKNIQRIHIFFHNKRLKEDFKKNKEENKKLIENFKKNKEK